MTASVALAAVALSGLLAPGHAHAQVAKAATGGVTQYVVPADDQKAVSIEDIRNARPMPLPRVNAPAEGPLDGGLSKQKLGPGKMVPGKQGTGKTAPVAVPTEQAADDPEEIEPQEFGTANHPYTTARVDVTSNLTSKAYPFRAAGKLYLKDGETTYVCSASLIKRGVIVTAAHCVAAFGQKRFYTGFQFVPAKYDATAPYGIWVGGAA